MRSRGISFIIKRRREIILHGTIGTRAMSIGHVHCTG